MSYNNVTEMKQETTKKHFAFRFSTYSSCKAHLHNTWKYIKSLYLLSSFFVWHLTGHEHRKTSGGTRRKRSNRNNNNNDMKWRNERQFWHPSQQEALPILHGAYSITTSICYLLLLLLFTKHSSFLFFVIFKHFCSSVSDWIPAAVKYVKHSFQIFYGSIILPLKCLT